MGNELQWMEINADDSAISSDGDLQEFDQKINAIRRLKMQRDYVNAIKWQLGSLLAIASTEASVQNLLCRTFQNKLFFEVSFFANIWKRKLVGHGHGHGSNIKTAN